MKIPIKLIYVGLNEFSTFQILNPIFETYVFFLKLFIQNSIFLN